MTIFGKDLEMRLHTVEYWERQLLAEEKNANKSSIRCKDPANPEELMNCQLAEFYISQMKLVA